MRRRVKGEEHPWRAWFQSDKCREEYFKWKRQRYPEKSGREMR